MIAIIDYGVGNLRSVEKAFQSVGVDVIISSDADTLRSADKLVLPGVGAFGDAMRGLRAPGFDILVKEAADAGKPILGLCVGLQMMFDEGLEFGRHEGLGLIPGRVVLFPKDGPLVPHIGWNRLKHLANIRFLKTCPNILISILFIRITSNQPTILTLSGGPITE